MSETGKALRASDWTVKPALCLDLDGTIRFNRDDPAGFINTVAQIALFDDVEDRLWLWREGGVIFGADGDYDVPPHLIFGISNQGGAAFGYKTSVDVDREIERTVDLFERNPFHIIKCCLHHEKGTVEHYAHRSLLRKPDIGMLALMEVECFEESIIVDWDSSLFVGDRGEDEECARRANIRFAHADEFFGRTR